MALLLGLTATTAARAGMEIPAELPPDSPAVGSAERQALIEFQQDPMANGQALLRLSAGSVQRLPLVVLLAAGDVHLRAGRVRAATRFFREAARREPGPPWDGFARLGLGWTAVARHQFGAAAKYYRDIDPASPLGAIARVMTAWLTALQGRYAAAQAAFDDAAAAAGLPPNVRQVALLGAAYTRYWLGAFDAAATAFDRLVSPPSMLSDDARYGAAWARLRADRTDVAIPALVALAGEGPADVPVKRIADAAVNLSPSTVTRSGRDSTARISGFAGPDARMVATFDGDGVAMARAALAMLARRGEVHPADLPAPLVALLPDVVAAAVPGAEARPATERAGAAAPPPASAPRAGAAGSSWWRVWWIAMGILALALVAAVLRRGDTRASRVHPR